MGFAGEHDKPAWESRGGAHSKPEIMSRLSRLVLGRAVSGSAAHALTREALTLCGLHFFPIARGVLEFVKVFCKSVGELSRGPVRGADRGGMDLSRARRCGCTDIARASHWARGKRRALAVAGYTQVFGVDQVTTSSLCGVAARFVGLPRASPQSMATPSYSLAELECASRLRGDKD